MFRFLWADDTKGALQVFLQQPGLLVKTPSSGGVTDEVVEEGAWINADPVKGCVVCNIGESECSGSIMQGMYSILTLCYELQCGRFGRTGCTRAHYTGSFTGVVTIGTIHQFSAWDSISNTRAYVLVFRELSSRLRSCSGDGV